MVSTRSPMAASPPTAEMATPSGEHRASGTAEVVSGGRCGLGEVALGAVSSSGPPAAVRAPHPASSTSPRTPRRTRLTPKIVPAGAARPAASVGGPVHAGCGVPSAQADVLDAGPPAADV